jgi:polyisoprenoid-binding protein YceI
MKNKFFYSAITAALLFASCSGGDSSKVEEKGEAASAAAEAKSFTIDNESSSVKWLAKKVTGEHNGTVTIKSGAFQVEEGKIAAGEFALDMTSITVLDMPADDEYNVKLTGHLKSEDFFSVEKSPEANFEIVSVEKIEGATEGQPNYNVKGNLTIKGISKAITFPATVNMDENSVKANAEFELDRTEWDIKYGSGKFFPEIGDKMIYDNFTIMLDIVAKA